MTRFFTVLAFAGLLASPALAADDGGFGSKFTNQTPSALMEAPNSTLAQAVPDASSVQNIMPAAGNEASDTTDAPAQKADQAKDIIKAAPTTVHQSIESHVTVPAGVGK